MSLYVKGFVLSDNYRKLWELAHNGYRIPGWVIRYEEYDPIIYDLVEIKLIFGEVSIGSRGVSYSPFENTFDDFEKTCRKYGLQFVDVNNIDCIKYVEKWEGTGLLEGVKNKVSLSYDLDSLAFRIINTYDSNPLTVDESNIVFYVVTELHRQNYSFKLDDLWDWLILGEGDVKRTAELCNDVTICNGDVVKEMAIILSEKYIEHEKKGISK